MVAMAVRALGCLPKDVTATAGTFGEANLAAQLAWRVPLRRLRSRHERATHQGSDPSGETCAEQQHAFGDVLAGYTPYSCGFQLVDSFDDCLLFSGLISLFGYWHGDP